MSANNSFKVAAQAEAFSAWVFWVLTAASAALLVPYFQRLEGFLQPLLIVGAISGILAGAIVTVYQNQGNRLLRASQLTNALGSPIGDAVRDDYYNTALPPSLTRLAATTLENTLFTTEVLMKMLRKERAAVAIYITIFLLLLAYRGTSLNWLVFLAQSLFSADVVLSWLRMERFRLRTVQVHEQLRQFFLQGGNAKKPNGVAIILAAFTDYECAKDEAGMPLDSSIFTTINPAVSQRWETLKHSLGLQG